MTRRQQIFASLTTSSSVLLKLPHPYLTPYIVTKSPSCEDSFQLTPQPSPADAKPLPTPLHNPSLSFTEPVDLKLGDRPKDSNNTAWARARRSPAVTVRWADDEPTIGQLWLVTYAVFTVRGREEAFRLRVEGKGAENVKRRLKVVGLGVDHPKEAPSTTAAAANSEEDDEILILRSSFWQGAGSPFGPRPAWTPETQDPDLSNYPLPPPAYTLSYRTSSGGAAPDLSSTTPRTPSWHPHRRAKPAPGSVIYSRWIPHLGETFSMVALDVENEKHVALFHNWQNDPRVSQGWDLRGTLDQHREYLRKVRDDPHRLAVIGRFEGVEFAYFEVYWAKEDPISAYYPADDYDRGRHSLVGDVRYRGPHRVSAWWSSLMHYLFLDEPRTRWVVGEPKHTNSSVLVYDLSHGFSLEKLIDLPQKRSALMRCSRERFFQMCPLDENEKVVLGTGVGLVPKL